MYDDLVKRLRELASIPEHCENVSDCDKCTKEEICLSFTNKQIIETATKAADAIEVLSKLILEMGQVGKFLLDVHKINSKMVDPESIPTDSEWWSHYKALLELLYLPRWIPVTERLPFADSGYVSQKVLVTDGQDMATAEWFNFEMCEPFWSYTGMGDITHWMPLPEPPKEEP